MNKSRFQLVLIVDRQCRRTRDEYYNRFDDDQHSVIRVIGFYLLRQIAEFDKHTVDFTRVHTTDTGRRASYHTFGIKHINLGYRAHFK